MNKLATGEPDIIKNEREAVEAWINSFAFPSPPEVELKESKEIIEAIKEKFDKALKFAAKKNNLPF